jgi:hypothetical protein
MKEQIETVVSHMSIVPGDNNTPRKTAMGHSCKTLPASEKKEKPTSKIRLLCTYFLTPKRQDFRETGKHL